MASASPVSSLSDLDFIPYVNAQGLLPQELAGKVGVYSIFAADKTLQYIGYSRDIYLSLKQHLVRQPHLCYWVKVQTIERPNRTVLEQIRTSWIAQYGLIPPGNGAEQARWDQPIDVKAAMTHEEATRYNNPELDSLAQLKILKNTARRLEAEILATLEVRQVREALRFNPKLKENGVLDLK